MKILVFAAITLLSLVSTSVLAGKTGGGGTYAATITTTRTFAEARRTETRAFIGLNWAMGSGYTPALVLGATNTRVKSNGDTRGARLAFHLKLAGGVAPGLLKLSYLHGKETLQGEVGAGFNFIKSAPLLGLGVNAPFAAAGIDGYSTSSFVPFFMLHSQGKFKKPLPIINSTSVATCDPGDIFLDAATCLITGMD